MQNVRRTVALGCVVAGLALTQQACGTEAPSVVASTAVSGAASPSGPATAPSSAGATGETGATGAPSASATGAGSPSAILDGERQMNIKLIEKPGGVLAIGSNSRLGVSDGGGAAALFVLQPTDDKYRIRAVKEIAGGATCLTVQSNGQSAQRVVVAACESSDTNQLFSLRTVEKDTDEGRPTFYIGTESGFLQWFPNGSGLIVEEIGDATLETTFALVDKGVSPLPTTGG